MPLAKLSKRPSPPQNAFRTISVCRNVSQGEGVGEEDIGRHPVCCGGDNYITGVLNLKSEEIIRLNHCYIGHADRIMIRPEFAEDNVEGDCFRALTGEFVGDAAVNVAWPIQSRSESEREIGADKIDTALVDGNKPELSCDGRGVFESLSSAHVVSDPFETFEEFHLQEPQEANEDNHSYR